MDIVDNVRSGKYRTKLDYPKMNNTCKCGNRFKEGDSFCSKCGSKVEDYKAIYKEQLKTYREDEGKLCEKFRKDALKDVGLSKHEAKDRAFNMAWSDGHSSGMEEVYYHLINIAYVITGE